MEDVERAGGSLARWVPAILYAGAIFVFSSVPGQDVPDLGVSDKLEHFALFAGFGAVLAFAWRRPVPAVLAAGLYGLLDEVHQRFTPGRDASVADLVADVAGAVAGAALVALALHLWQRRSVARGFHP